MEQIVSILVAVALVFIFFGYIFSRDGKLKLYDQLDEAEKLIDNLINIHFFPKENFNYDNEISQSKIERYLIKHHNIYLESFEDYKDARPCDWKYNNKINN